MVGKFDYRSFIQAQTGIDVKQAVKGVLRSTKDSALNKASQYVTESKVVQARAKQAVEEGAVTAMAAKIAEFYQKNKTVTIGLAVGVPVALFALAFMVIGKKKA